MGIGVGTPSMGESSHDVIYLCFSWWSERLRQAVLALSEKIWNNEPGESLGVSFDSALAVNSINYVSKNCFF